MTIAAIEARIYALRKIHEQEIGCRAGVFISILEELRDAKNDQIYTFLAELKDWQLSTFPDETPMENFLHLEEEVEELIEDLANPMELADCLMLLCCLCFRAGIDPIEAMKKKHAVNLARRWQKTEKGFRHVKSTNL